MAKIKLHHRQYEGLVFGPNSEIKFGLRGGFEPGYCVIDENDPLYAELWRLEGNELEVVNAAGPAKVYVSPLEPDREFKSKPQLMAHVRAAAKSGNALAIAWLASLDDPADAVEA